ncbi:hypothetical protein BVG79_01087 [Ketogulonicigenium robustum]|uniref:N-acetyltransferase domain-containing protein n=1 Tax=Ketogulonicigenium robustum TaxID=92947 RepID=A0A1W6NZ54_9RHOB|nr:hypothetical protein [Ketogulonicigenium robustum]ARO14433.1 hypothetical protein BVG79_01087 [Ketogulonicigenium robustum]
MTRATLDDLPTLIQRMGRFHAASGLASRFDPEATGAFLTACVIQGAVFLTDRGCIGGMLAPHWCDPSHIMAVEMFWHADGDGLALLRDFEAWAKGAGASEVRMTSLASLPRADRLLKAKGYAPCEISYSKVV